MSMQRPVGLVVSLVVVVLVAVLGWVLVPGGQSASPDTTPHRDVADEAEQSAAEEPAPVEAPTGETVMVSQERQAFEPGRLLVGDPAPALSIIEIDGKRFWSMISEMRPPFRTPSSFTAPPLTVASLAETIHSTPETTPIPAMEEAPGLCPEIS